MGFDFLIPSEDPKQKNKFNKTVRAINSFVKRQPGRRENSNFSPSGLQRLCPREYTLNHYMQKEYPPSDFKSGFYMNVGRLTHERIQRSILGPMGLLYGKWQKDKEEVTGYYPGEGWKFRETKLYLDVVPEIKIAGYIDGLIDTDRYQWLLDGCPGEPPEPTEDFYIWEFKTMNDFSYKHVKCAADISDGYKMQAEMYQEMVGSKKVLFWILNTSTWSGRFIEYDYNGMWYSIAKNKIAASIQGIHTKQLPIAYSACEDVTCERAKKCPYREECFDPEFDLESWLEENSEELLVKEEHENTEGPDKSIPG